MKGEVLERLETMQEWTEEAYNNVVDTVAAEYKQIKHIDATQISEIVKDLKSHWNEIQKQLKGGAKTTKKSK